MSEQAIEPGVVECGHQQQGPKRRRITMASLGDDIEAVLFIGRWQVRSHRRRVVGSPVTMQSASFSQVLSNLLGEGQS
jgi:hypothetical protein